MNELFTLTLMLQNLPFKGQCSCQISGLLLHSSHDGAVGSASAWQARGRCFEPVLMCYCFSGKYPGA